MFEALELQQRTRRVRSLSSWSLHSRVETEQGKKEANKPVSTVVSGSECTEAGRQREVVEAGCRRKGKVVRHRMRRGSEEEPAEERVPGRSKRPLVSRALRASEAEPCGLAQPDRWMIPEEIREVGHGPERPAS